MKIPIIDCHQHLIYADRFPYSWTKDIPQLKGRSFTYEDYLSLIEGKGEIQTLFMETAPDAPHYTGENELAMELADRPETLVEGLILSCRPEEKGFTAYLDSVQHTKLVGLRRILHVEDDAMSQQPGFVENVSRLASRNLTFDMCFLPRQLPLACDLADQCPDVQFILDHCGIPNVAGQELDPWRADLGELAKRSNVACKISGVLAYCDPANATIDAVRPFVEYAIETFGWDRVVWGSDWPVVCMTRDLPDWIDISRELVSDEDEANQHKLFHKNAERIYLKRESGEPTPDM